MKNSFFELVDFEKVNVLLEGFNKTTGFVTAILDLDGNVLSKSGWRKMCTDFHRINPKTAQKCGISDTVLANKLASGDKFHFYKCLNGLVDVAVPIIIKGEHLANLFSGQFFFEEPDRLFFQKQAEKYGFDETKYMEALDKVPVLSKEEVEVAMEFMLNMIQLISETGIQKMEQIQLNIALKDSEERFQLLFNKAPLGYQSLDINGHFIEVNQQWLDTLGYERDEVIGKWFGGFLTPMYQDGFRKRFPIFKAQGHIHSEFEMVHKNGSILFIAFDGKIGSDAYGNFKQTHCILQDITETKRVKEALLDAEWKFKALFELGPIGVAYHSMIYDEAGKPIDYYFIDANDSYNELTGVSPKGMTVREAFPGIENDPADWIGMFGHVAKTGETIRFEQFLESNQRWYDCVGYQYKPDHFVAAFNEITKRKVAEIALQDSELRFKILFDDAPDAMLLADPETGKIIDVNNKACSLFKKQKHELIGIFQHELHPVQNEGFSKKTFKEQFESTKQIQNNEPIENRICCSDGTEIPVEIIGKAIQLDGKLLMLGTFRDITVRKKAEQKLKALEQQSHTWLENSPACTKIVDLDFNLQFMSSAGIKGLKIDDITAYYGKPYPFHFYPESFKTKMTGNMKKAIETGEVITQEAPVVDIKGNEIWFHSTIVPSKDDNGRVEYLIIVSVDITENKLKENALRESETQYRNLANSGLALVWTSGTDKLHNYFNEPWLKFTGRTLEQEMGNGWSEGVHPDDFDRYLATYVNAFDKKEAFEMEYRLRHVSGDYRWILDMGTPNINSNNEFVGFIGNCFDINERKIIEDTQAFLLQISNPDSDDNFFDSLAIHLSKSLDMEYVCIDILDGDELTAQTLAIYNEGNFEPNVSYALKDTPCGEVVDNHICCYPSEVRSLFPNDPALNDIKAESYIGTTLRNSDGKAIGLIAVIGQKPLLNNKLATTVLKLVSLRAAGKLEATLAEKKLLENEERFRNFFENSVVGKSVTSIDGKLSVNNAFCNIVGYSEAELKNLNWKEITHVDDIELNITILNSILSGEKQSERWEKRYIHKDGHIVWTDISTTLQRDGKGNPLYFITAIIDITERKKAEKALNESKKMLEQVMNCIPQFIFWKDRNSAFLGCNENFARAAGLKSAFEIVGKTDYDLPWKEEESDFFVECDKRVMNSGISEYKIIEPQQQADGKQAWLETNKVPIIDENGQVIGILGAYEDITERKKAEETLRKSEERYSNLLLHLETGIVVHAPDTSIITNNPRASELLGLTSDQMKGKTAIDPAWKFVNVDNTPLKLEDYPVNRIVKSKSSILNQILGVHKSINDDIEWLSVNGFPALSSEGEIIEIVISFNDITERRNAELLLENERALYLDLVNTQPAGIYRIRVFPKASWEDDAWTKVDSPPYKLELISDRFCEILEINPEKFESHPGLIIDLVHPDDKEEFVRRNDEANTFANNFSWDCRLLINNNIKWIHFESLPRKLENGDILYTGIIFDITEQKNAEEALRESKEKFRTIIETIPGVVYECDVDWNFIFASNGFKELTGFPASDIINNNIRSFVSLMFEDDIERINPTLDEAIKRNDQFYFSEYKLKTKSSDIVWVHDSVRILYNAKNEAIGYKGVILDITDRKLAQKALQESEEKYRSLLENSGLGVGVYSPDGKVILYNQKALENMAGTAQDYIGKSIFEIFDEQSATVYYNRIQETIKSEKAPEYEDFVTLSSGDYWFISNFTKIKNDKGEVIAVQIISHDISVRKYAEQALKESEELLSLYIKNSPIYSFIKEVSENESKVLYASENFIDMIGISGHEMIGKTMYELFPPEFAKKITADDWDVHKTSEVLNLDETLNGKDYITIKFPIAQGNRNLLAGFTIDISERKHAEEQMSMQLQELRRWYDVTLDREGRVLELKHEVNELLKEHGKALRYESATGDNTDTSNNV